MEVMCVVCEGQVSKYKCPACRIYYCSVACWKTHKSSGCTPLSNGSIVQEQAKEEIPFPTEDTVPIEKLRLLEENEDLKDILRNPHVRNMLSAVDNATDPAAAIKAAMLEPIFVEFADKCLEIVEPSSNST